MWRHVGDLVFGWLCTFSLPPSSIPLSFSHVLSCILTHFFHYLLPFLALHFVLFFCLSASTLYLALFSLEYSNLSSEFRWLLIFHFSPYNDFSLTFDYLELDFFTLRNLILIFVNSQEETNFREEQISESVEKSNEKRTWNWRNFRENWLKNFRLNRVWESNKREIEVGGFLHGIWRSLGVFPFPILLSHYFSMRLFLLLKD